MTERELDDILREGLIIINTPECLALPDEPFPTSEKFERKMAKLRANPNRYLRKLKRAARPLWRKVLSTAAAVLVVLSLSLGAVMAVSPTARAWVQKVVVQWLEEYVGFQFYGGEKKTGNIWRPVWLPEGVLEISASDVKGYGTILFEGDDENIISFKYQPLTDQNQINVDNKHLEYEGITLNGHDAFIFLADSEDKTNYLIWTDEDQTTAFRVVGELSKDELLMIAESVKVDN